MRKKKLSPENIIKAAEAFATGTASRRKLQAQGIPQRQYAVLADASTAPLETFRTHLRGVLACTITAMSERLRDEVSELSTAQLPIALGILTDKHSGLTEPKNAALHFHFYGKDRAKLMAGIIGADVQRTEIVADDTQDKPTDSNSSKTNN